MPYFRVPMERVNVMVVASGPSADSPTGPSQQLCDGVTRDSGNGDDVVALEEKAHCDFGTPHQGSRAWQQAHNPSLFYKGLKSKASPTANASADCRRQKRSPTSARKTSSTAISTVKLSSGALFWAHVVERRRREEALQLSKQPNTND